ncbi:hypothetical protein PIB30_106504, partial [Stylosanthes scabra]|nr:hypothetical protein [Stylosanthes scabra]
EINLFSSDKACIWIVFSTCKLLLGSHCISVELKHQILAYLCPWLAKSPPPSKSDLFTNFMVLAFLKLKALFRCDSVSVNILL